MTKMCNARNECRERREWQEWSIMSVEEARDETKILGETGQTELFHPVPNNTSV